MKKLSAVLGAYSPKSPDEIKFADKHKGEKKDDVAGNGDKLFKASNIKAVNRESPDNHGYNPGDDEKVYEAKHDPDCKCKGCCSKRLRKEEVEIEEDNDALRFRQVEGRHKREMYRLVGAMNKEDAPKRRNQTYSDWRKEGKQPIKKALGENNKQAFAKLLGSPPKKDTATEPALNGPNEEKNNKKFKAMMNPKEGTEMRQLPNHIKSIVENIVSAKNPIPGGHPGSPANDAEEKLPLSILKSDGTGSALFSHKNMAGNYVWAGEEGNILGVSNMPPSQKRINDGGNFYKHNGDHLVRITKGT